MIKFIHAADLHLGMRITRFDEEACGRIGEARFAALDQLRKLAHEHRVDFILIAGDVFDDHSVSRSKVADRAFRQFEGKSIACPIFIIPGNHDPLTPGGVWDRDPWTREQPHKQVRLLRDARPVPVPGLPVVIFPCPLRHRVSVDDPTAWISEHPKTAGDATIRIGLAHGSLQVLPQLPEDDHLIRPDAADALGLDYLAPGHWHKPFFHKAGDGAVRTAYCGTHEPMRFPGSAANSTGWSSYSSDGDADRFADPGAGSALLVSIDSPRAPPRIETLETGWLRWSAETRDLTARPLGELVSEFGQRLNCERTLLRLTLQGVVTPRAHARIAEELLPIVTNRYHPGSSVDSDAVLVEPDAEELRSVVGPGVLSRVLERLSQDRQSPNADERRVADHALKLLYRIAWEVQPG